MYIFFINKKKLKKKKLLFACFSFFFIYLINQKSMSEKDSTQNIQFSFSANPIKRQLHPPTSPVNRGEGSSSSHIDVNRVLFLRATFALY